MPPEPEMAAVERLHFIQATHPKIRDNGTSIRNEKMIEKRMQMIAPPKLPRLNGHDIAISTSAARAKWRLTSESIFSRATLMAASRGVGDSLELDCMSAFSALPMLLRTVAVAPVDMRGFDCQYRFMVSLGGCKSMGERLETTACADGKCSPPPPSDRRRRANEAANGPDATVAAANVRPRAKSRPSAE